MTHASQPGERSEQHAVRGQMFRCAAASVLCAASTNITSVISHHLLKTDKHRIEWILVEKFYHFVKCTFLL